MNANEEREVSTAAPFLNDYKRKFVVKRLVQNIFGGIVVKVNSDDDLPWFIYMLQIILFTMPFLFGGVGILIADVNNDSANIVRLNVSIIVACLFFLYLIVLKLTSTIVVNLKHFKSEQLKISKKKEKSKKRNELESYNLNIVDDEMNYVFDAALFSIDTLKFILPPIGLFISNEASDDGKLKLDIHACFTCAIRVLFDSACGGVLMFCSVYFESIVYLQRFYPIAGAVCVFVLHWLVLALSFYSLCVREPPEPAIYQSYDLFKIQHYTRAFYVFCFQLIELVYNFSPNNAQIPLQAIFWLKIVFIFLPFLWFFGVLPPIDAFCLYLLEQSYVYLYGGSPTSTNIRLVIQLCMAVLVSMVHFIPSDLAIVILLACSGYILASIDLVYLFEYFMKWVREKRVKITPVTTPTPTPDNKKSYSEKKSNAEFPLSLSDWLFHLVMFALTVASVVGVYVGFQNAGLNKKLALQIENGLLYAGIGIFVLVKLFADLQGVYLFFGFIRNPFYPKKCLSSSTSSKDTRNLSINQNKLFFKLIKYVRLVLIRIVSPILLVIVITIDCYINKVYNDPTLSYWRTLIVLRAFRWVWQSSYLCLFEMSIMTNIILLSISYNSVSDDMVKDGLMQHFLTGCLIASFARDRLQQFFSKLYTYFLLTVTSYSIKKQRRKTALVFFVLNFIFFIPLGISVLMGAALLSAPLLPLFTFPIFLIGFPRTKRFWPQKNNFFSTSSISSDGLQTKNYLPSSDTSFYAQLVPKLIPSIKEFIRSASIGSSLHPDTFFLSRFQDRIVWIQIMESSSTFCVLNVKGLELQETSCHTREAQHIDDAFDSAFESASVNSSIKKHFNPTPFNCMQPCDVLLFDAYSDAKNSLVGLIDHPDTLSLIATFYPKILHYFLIKYLMHEVNFGDEEKYDEKLISKESIGNLFNNNNKIDEKSSSYLIKTPLGDLEDERFDEAKKSEKQTTSQEIYREEKVKSPPNKQTNSAHKIQVSDEKEKGTDLDDWSDTNSYELDFDNPKTRVNSEKNAGSSKLGLTPENEDTFDFNLNEIIGAVDAEARIPNYHVNGRDSTNEAKVRIPSAKRSSRLDFTKPQSAIKKPNRLPQIDNNYIISTPKNVLSRLNIEENSAQIFNLPIEWTRFLNENVNTSQALLAENKTLRSTLTSRKWIQSVLSLISMSTNDETQISGEAIEHYENNLSSMHFVFLQKCCFTLGISEKNVANTFSPQLIHKFFHSNLPWSPTNEKIAKNLPELSSILIKAFRYTVKMVIDHCSICPITEDEEFFDTLKTYEQEWYIGVESDSDYSKNILNNKEFLFSLYKDNKNKTLNSRTLTLQKIKSPLAQLNSEIVKSIWSSTNLELLFMTNDDDERYSIQAHPHILRNLSIQSSDPPLGYCIYNSENIYVSLVNPFY